MFLGAESTSLAAGVQRDAGGQNQAARPRGLADRDGGANLLLRLAWFDRVDLGDGVTTGMKRQVEKIFDEIDIAIE